MRPATELLADMSVEQLNWFRISQGVLRKSIDKRNSAYKPFSLNNNSDAAKQDLHAARKQNQVLVKQAKWKYQMVLAEKVSEQGFKEDQQSNGKLPTPSRQALPGTTTK